MGECSDDSTFPGFVLLVANCLLPVAECCSVVDNGWFCSVTISLQGNVPIVVRIPHLWHVHAKEMDPFLLFDMLQDPLALGSQCRLPNMPTTPGTLLGDGDYSLRGESFCSFIKPPNRIYQPCPFWPFPCSCSQIPRGCSRV